MDFHYLGSLCDELNTFGIVRYQDSFMYEHFKKVSMLSYKRITMQGESKVEECSCALECVDQRLQGKTKHMKFQLRILRWRPGGCNRSKRQNVGLRKAKWKYIWRSIVTRTWPAMTTLLSLKTLWQKHYKCIRWIKELKLLLSFSDIIMSQAREISYVIKMLE